MFEVADLLHLRPFRLADAAAIEPWLAGPGLSMPSGRLGRQWPQRVLADSRILVLVAEARGRRIGFVRLDCGPDQVAELTLVVAPGCRRHGFGSAMFVAAMHHARRLGLRALVANVDGPNQVALAFFAEQGFTCDGLAGDRVLLRRLVHAGDHAAPLDIG